MAMRRPRIKAVANIQLSSKRKAKPIADVKPTLSISEIQIDSISHQDNTFVEDGVRNESAVGSENVAGKEVRTSNREEEISSNKNNNETYAVESNLNANDNNNEKSTDTDNCKTKRNVEQKKDVVPENQEHSDEAFKCPPSIEYERSTSHTSNSGVDDVFYSDIEENALQMDSGQQNSAECPNSPSKSQTRQRIRATPLFGQRRNSFVSSSSPSAHTGSDNEKDNAATNTANNNEFVTPIPPPIRRERHHSSSMSTNSTSSTHHHTPHKYFPAGIMQSGTGRTRTESGCSVHSDTNVSIHKTRRNEDHHNHRVNPRKDFEARFGTGIPDKAALKMSDLIYYNPTTNPMEKKPNPNLLKLENQSVKNETAGNDEKSFAGKKEKDNATDNSQAMPVPQLKLNSNGELILDDKSLVIETTAEQEARKVLANSSLIYLDENTGMNGFYKRQKRTREWPAAETIKFYRCLQTVGTDFSLMVSLFPNRTRRDLKLKFKKEERINGNLINKALLYPKQFDVEDLKRQVEEEELEHARLAEEQKKLKENQIKEKKAKKFVPSTATRVLEGVNIYKDENNSRPRKPRATRKVAAKSKPVVEKVENLTEAKSENICNNNNNNNIININNNLNNIKTNIIDIINIKKNDTTSNNNNNNANNSNNNNNDNNNDINIMNNCNNNESNIINKIDVIIENKHSKAEENNNDDANDDAINSKAIYNQRKWNKKQAKKRRRRQALKRKALKESEQQSAVSFNITTDISSTSCYLRKLSNWKAFTNNIAKQIDDVNAVADENKSSHSNATIKNEHFDSQSQISQHLEQTSYTPADFKLPKVQILDGHYNDGEQQQHGKNFIKHLLVPDTESQQLVNPNTYYDIKENTDSISSCESVLYFHDDPFQYSTAAATEASGSQPMDIDQFEEDESRTIINLDDGSVTTLTAADMMINPVMNNSNNSSSSSNVTMESSYSSSSSSSSSSDHDTKVSTPADNYVTILAPNDAITSIASPPDLNNAETCSSQMSVDRELNEQDIQQILTELAEGSLVLVSTLDPDDPDKVLNEIYMVDKNTGDLCDEPLGIPENIVQCILSVMS